MNREEQLRQVINQYLAASPEQRANVPQDVLNNVINEYDAITNSDPIQPGFRDYTTITGQKASDLYRQEIGEARNLERLKQDIAYYGPQGFIDKYGEEGARYALDLAKRNSEFVDPIAYREEEIAPQVNLQRKQRTRITTPKKDKKTNSEPQDTTIPQYDPTKTMPIPPKKTPTTRNDAIPESTTAPQQNSDNGLYAAIAGVSIPALYGVGYYLYNNYQKNKTIREMKNHLGHIKGTPQEIIKRSGDKVVPRIKTDNVEGIHPQSKTHLSDMWLDRYILTNGQKNILPKTPDMVIYDAARQTLPNSMSVGSHRTLSPESSNIQTTQAGGTNKYFNNQMNQIRNNALGEYHKHELGKLVSKEGDITKKDLQNIDMHTKGLDKLGIDFNPFATRKILKTLSHK